LAFANPVLSDKPDTVGIRSTGSSASGDEEAAQADSVAAKAALDSLVGAAADAMAAVTRLHMEYLDALAEAEPDFSGKIRNVVALDAAVRKKMDSRVSRPEDRPVYLVREPRFRRGSLGGENIPVDYVGWIEAAETFLRELRVLGVPVIRSRRLPLHHKHATRMWALHDAADSVVHNILAKAREMTMKAAASRMPARDRHADPPSMSPPAALFDYPGWSAWKCPRVMNPLTFAVGWFEPMTTVELGCPTVYDLTSVSSGKVERKDAALPFPGHIPALLDLDKCRGLLTDDRRVVNNVILHALLATPAGQLRCDLFDPLRLGESAGFLYGLGDSAERILGHKVRTTERELADLLLAIEEHITFVTQKYLQGTHESLTAYNEAAGEVAEPYRLLVLYDYPSGFFRYGGHLDPEILARLGKIIEAGPRCGVFTLVYLNEDVVPAKNSDAVEAILAPFGDSALLLTKSPTPLTTVRQMCPLETEAAVFGLQGSITRSQEPWTLERLTGGKARSVVGVTLTWFFKPGSEPAPELVRSLIDSVETALRNAQDVQVDEARVYAFDRARLARLGQAGPSPVDPADPATWWAGSTITEIAVPFGRVGASDVGVLSFDERGLGSALLGGRPGSGKSVLLHTLISGLVRRYSPHELELYLVDFKEGVEFAPYAAHRLPHARVVAVESEREFGISVLEGLDKLMSERGAQFRSPGESKASLNSYRMRTGEVMPRVLLVIDEFHVLFERDDKLAGRAAELLDRVIRQGRAFGVHALLASQTIAGTAALGRHTLNQIPIRIAMQSSEVDSRLLLGDDNADARLLSRPGEGIFNARGGLRDANQRFQASFVLPDHRDEALVRLREMADADGDLARRAPVVFEGRAVARADDMAREEFLALTAGRHLTTPVGMPMTLEGPVTAQLRREPGGNMLIVGADDAALGALCVLVAGLAARPAAMTVIDFLGIDEAFTEVLEPVVDGGAVTFVRARRAPKVLADVAGMVQERHTLSDFRAPATVLVLGGIHRARDLDPYGGPDSMGDQLGAILRDGPEVGVHVIAWVDKSVSLGRRLDRSLLREFGIRLLFQMSKEDSYSLIDSDAAAQINETQAVLDDVDRGRTIKLRPFAVPRAEWLMDIAAKAGTTADSQDGDKQ
jgi:hypothetical protein